MEKGKAGLATKDKILNDKDFKRSVINTDEQTTKRSVERTLKGKLVSIYDTQRCFTNSSQRTAPLRNLS